MHQSSKYSARNVIIFIFILTHRNWAWICQLKFWFKIFNLQQKRPPLAYWEITCQLKKLAPFVMSDLIFMDLLPDIWKPKKYIWMFAFSFISTHLWLCFDNAIDYVLIQVLIQVLIHKFSLNFLTCHTRDRKCFDCSNPSWLKAYQ